MDCHDFATQNLAMTEKIQKIAESAPPHHFVIARHKVPKQSKILRIALHFVILSKAKNLILNSAILR
ncbi:hypothetical protein [Helicobacter sp. 23-1045]